VRVPGKAGGVERRVVVAEVIQQQERVEGARIVEAESALEMDPGLRRQFDPSAPPQPGRGQRLRAILEDREFMQQLFPAK